MSTRPLAAGFPSGDFDAAFWAKIVVAYGLRGVTQSVDEPSHDAAAKELDDTQWRSLLDTCAVQRMLGLLGAFIADGHIAVTGSQAEDLHERLVAALAGDLIRERELVSVVELLDRAGIDHRALKGPAVAHLDYADPALRSFADVDLLVRSDQWDRAVSVLEADGWQRFYAEPRPGFDRRFVKGTVLTHKHRNVELDLHRTLALGPFGLTVNLGDLWDRHDMLRLGGRQVRVLAREERFLHACFHASLGDLPPRLVPLRDIAQIALSGHLDWRRVLSLAQRWQAEAVLQRGLQLAWETLALDPDTRPDVAAYGTLTVSSRQARALRGYTSSSRSYVGLCVANVAAIPGPAYKVRYLAALAFPKRSYLQGRYASRGDRLRSAARTLWRSHLRRG